jgi:uncharacterized protein (DUF983 family)
VASFLRGILRQVCPRCRRGAIFAAPVFRAPFRMNAECPVCGLKFDREHGYFTGAMYVTSALMIPPACLLYFLWLAMDWPFEYVLAGAALASLPLLPVVVRLSRVVWIWVDRKFDP